MRTDIRQHIWEYIVCVLLCWSISANTFAGYAATDPRSGSFFWIVGTSAFFLAILFVSHFHKYGMRISVPVTLLALVCGALFLNSQDVLFRIWLTDESPYLFWTIVITVSIAVFWAARTRAGIIFLFLAETLMIAGFGFLEYPLSLAGYGITILSTVTLFLYRSGGSHGFHLVRSAAAALIVCLLASGVYYVIMPLTPSADGTELTQRLMSMQLIKDAGISSKKVIVRDKPEVPEPKRAEEQKQEQNVTKVTEKSDQGGHLGDSGSLFDVLAVTYKRNSALFGVLGAVVVLLFILAFPLKLLQRKKWYSALDYKSNEEAAAELYFYFIRKLKKAGYQRPENLTLLEYAVASQEKLDKFSVYDASFFNLTQIYVKMYYGCQKVSEDEWELFQDFYKEFHKNLRSEMGRIKYGFHFFTI